jgi:hypothetical protein
MFSPEKAEQREREKRLEFEDEGLATDPEHVLSTVDLGHSRLRGLYYKVVSHVDMDMGVGELHPSNLHRTPPERRREERRSAPEP